MKKLTRFLSTLIVLSLLTSSAFAALSDINWTWGEIIGTNESIVAPGATYRSLTVSSPIGPQQIHTVEFDPANEYLDVRAGMSNNNISSTQTVVGMAADFNKKGEGQVVAGINGDFFNIGQGDPFGIFIDNGELLSTPPQYSTAFGIKNDDTPFILTHGTIMNRTLIINEAKIGLSAINNRHRDNNSIVLYNDKFGSSTKAKEDSVEVVCDVLSGELREGETISLKVEAVYDQVGNASIENGKMVLSAIGSYKDTLLALSKDQEISVSLEFVDFWKDVKFAIAGNHILVQNGEAQSISGSERAPRTVVGIKEDGKVIFFTIDGRISGHSVGSTFNQTAKMLRDLGCVSAMNLDGGGSTTFVLRYLGDMNAQTINRPSDRADRAVANGALLVNTAPQGIPNKLFLSPNYKKVLIGKSYKINATGAMDSNYLSYPVPEDTVLSVNEDIGTLAQDGTFTPTAAGDVRITAKSETASGSIAFSVVDHISAINAPDSLKIESEKTQKLSVSLMHEGDYVTFSNDQLTWSTVGDIGTFTAPGEFVAGKFDATGSIIVSYGDVSKTIAVTVDSPEVFSDMESHKWAKDALYRLYDAGIVKGVSETEFAPARELKRADFILLLLRLMDVEVKTDITDQFEDVLPGSYYYNELATAKALGIARGTSDTTFAPERSITRQEMFTLTWRVLNEYEKLSDEADLSVLAAYADHSMVAEYAKQALSTLIGTGLIEGDNKNRLNPQNGATRAEAAVFLNRVNNLISEGSEADESTAG